MDMEERSDHLGGGIRPRKAGAEALREVWRRFKFSGARLKAVAMDISEPMRPACEPMHHTRF